MMKRFFLYYLMSLNTVFVIGAIAGELSLTFDDFDISDSVLLSAQERNQKILNTLDQSEGLQTTLFVIGKHVDSERGQSLLKEWDQHGHTIANHTYSHFDYGSSEIKDSQFSNDLLQAEPLLQKMTHLRGQTL